MGFGGFIFTIMVLIFIVSGIKRMMEALGREAQKNAPRGRGFEASASEVQEFLRNLQEARRQQTQVQVGQGRLRAPVRQGMRPGAPVPPEAPFWLGEPPGQANEEGPAVPVARPVRVRRRRKQEEDAVEALVATEPVKESPPPEPKAPPPETAAALKKVSLREAVIWSEILGPPLSVRRRRGGVPDSGRR